MGQTAQDLVFEDAFPHPLGTMPQCRMHSIRYTLLSTKAHHIAADTLHQLPSTGRGSPLDVEASQDG